MEIKSILNTGVTTIPTCESEPIHIPGSIQPHGFLLALDAAGQTIHFCSANTEAHLGLPPHKLLRQPLSVVGDEAVATIQSLMTSDQPEAGPRPVTLHNSLYDLFLHRAGQWLLVEGEPHLPLAREGAALFDQTSSFVRLLERARSLQELSRHMAEETRRITGYDRVMIYRFDKDYNGEVYAESRRDDLDPFLGLHYPHTDIPAQARALYLRNLARTIADVDYEPVPLLTLEAADNAALDLSDVHLRSVSPIHIQYLKNMGVAATLTVSLLEGGKLWGLIACHHYSPKRLSHAQRQAALLQGHFLSSQIRVRQVAEEYQVNISVEAHLQQLLSRIEAEEDFGQKFEQFTSLLPVANASGAVILHNGRLYEQGLVPPREKTLELIRWIDGHVRGLQFSTAHLSSRYPRGVEIADTASGLFYHALGKPTENCILWFREEVERTINWAGNPHEAVQRDAETKSLTPRRSFAQWKERVRHQSREWRVSERNAAQRFATALQNHFHLVHLQGEDFRLRTLNEKLQKANQELSNINWITTHDLKEPLRKIQIFASRIMTVEEQQVSGLIRQSLDRIQRSAERMQHLVDDILNYSLSTAADQTFALTDLNEVLAEVQDELREETEARGARFHCDQLPRNLRTARGQMYQLFYNLLSNALKFARPGLPPEVRITCQIVRGGDLGTVALPPDDPYYCLTVADNGIGFDPAQGQRLFDIFYRLHAREAYSGTGIGLAICKKIVEQHEGAILATAEEGKGARFTVLLPV